MKKLIQLITLARKALSQSPASRPQQLELPLE